MPYLPAECPAGAFVTPFPKAPEGRRLNNGELFGPAMEIVDAADAAQYLGALVDYIASLLPVPRPRAEIEQIERANLAYYAGYYDAETASRARRLFRECPCPPPRGTAAPAPSESDRLGIGQLDLDPSGSGAC